VVFAPKKSQVKHIALAGMLVPLAIVSYLLLNYESWATTGGKATTYAVALDWFPDIGLRLVLDLNSGVSVALVALTALLGPLCVIGSHTAITTRVRTYYGWLLVLQSAMLGVFCARDVILFYVFFEFTLVPMFVLISLYGSTNRKAAAIKFFLYTFTGSVIALAGLVYVAFVNATAMKAGMYEGAGTWTFALDTLTQASQRLPAGTQAWIFAALLLGFAVKVPLFPLHTWLPLAHTEAPTAGSVILAGVLLKLGTYGILVVAIPFAPLAAIAFAPWLAVLSICGILIAGLICWTQTDIKKLVAYSSVAHLGFCMLGMFAMNVAGVQGSVLYMINHGLSTGALFFCIGMMYERYHTRSLKEVGGLAAKMPVWACFMVFFAMASVGLPGLNGFISEFLCVMGAFQAGDLWAAQGLPGGTGGNLGPYFAAVAGTGMIIAAIYTLYMVGAICFGPLKEPAGHGDHGHGGHGAHASHAGDDHATLPTDLSAREIGVLLPLAALCLFLGLRPAPLMDLVDPAVKQTVEIVDKARAQAKAASAMTDDTTSSLTAR
jgi:NADH-quinone oxidoreductase subunit M